MDKKTLARIAKLTECNNHGAAYFIAAQALGQSKLAETFSAINKQHQREGKLSVELYRERFAAYTELTKYAKSHMSADAYQKFYMLF